MVVIKIKENGDNNFSKKINDDSLKIIETLKLCKIISDPHNENIEKKIEFLNIDKPNDDDKKYIDINYKELNDKYIFIGLQDGHRERKFNGKRNTNNYKSNASSFIHGNSRYNRSYNHRESYENSEYREYGDNRSEFYDG